MFYSESILSKKGPLGKVWLAAHWEKKLSKTQFLQTNIQNSIGAIMGGDQPPLALRLSGQLLLGVVRIYSRKARYLLEDCNDAFVKIQIAFRKGVIDMPKDQLVANLNSITLTDTVTEFDILLHEPVGNFTDVWTNPLPKSGSSSGLHISRREDITLQETWKANSTSLPSGSNLLGLDDDADLLPVTGDGSDLQLDLDLDIEEDVEVPLRDAQGDLEMADSNENSIEVPRDALIEDNVQLGDLLEPDKSMEEAEDTRGRKESLLPEFDIEFNGNDSMMEMKHGNIEPANLEDLLGDGAGGAREEGDLQITPFTERIVELPGSATTMPMFEVEIPQAANIVEQQLPHQLRKRRLVIDRVTELPSEYFKNQIKDTADVTTEPEFLPRSARLTRLCQMEGHVLAKSVLDLSAPPNVMLPRLRALFKKTVVGQLTKPEEEDKEESDVEKSMGGNSRRGSAVLEEANAEDASARPNGGEEVIEPFEDMPASSDEHSVAPLSPLRNDTDDSNVEEDSISHHHGSTSAVDIFGNDEVNDEEFSSSTQSSVQRKSASSSAGYSKTTIKAMNMLRSEFEKRGETEPTLFGEIAGKANKRDAAKFFFELLVLSTKNAVAVKQSKAYGEIEIQSKENTLESTRVIPTV